MKFTRDEIRKAMLLYAVTDQMWLKEGETLGDVVESVLRNGATFLQIREKDLAQDAFEAEAERLKTLCTQHGVPFVVNDSVEIALQCDADGVHVGQSDIKGRDIRAMIGPDKILGIARPDIGTMGQTGDDDQIRELLGTCLFQYFSGCPGTKLRQAQCTGFTRIDTRVCF